MFGFFKRLFRRKYIKYTFWTDNICPEYVQELFDMCSLRGYEVCDYIIKNTYFGYDIIVYTKKKEKEE